MPKKHHAKLTRLRCYCSKCDRTYLYSPDEVEFSGWSDGDSYWGHHGGSDMSFKCKGCKKDYTIILSEY